MRPIHPDKVAAVFITYMPTGDFVANVNKLFAQGVGEAIIVDNTPGDQFFSTLCFDLFDHPPRVVRNNENLGIACALNIGVSLARDLGYSWVVTFDQDTDVTPHFVSQMLRIYERIAASSLRPVAVLGANYYNQVFRVPAHAVDTEQEAVEVKEVITSGSLLSVAAFSSLGGFAEKLFIDMVDTEYCFRARQAGATVWRTSKPLMVHSLGRLTPRRIWRYRFNLSNHAPQRRYYIFRNTLYMVGRYFGFEPHWAMQMVFSYLPKTLVKACVFETNRWENFKYILRGIRDAVLSRYDRNCL